MNAQRPITIEPYQIWNSKKQPFLFHWSISLEIHTYTVNKGLAISRPQPGCQSPNSPWPGIIYPIPVPGRFGQQKNPGIL